MKEIVAVVRISMMNQTKQALTECGVDAFFTHEAHGRGQGFINLQFLEGTQHDYEEAATLLGEKGKLYPKRLLIAVVEDNMVDRIVKTIINTNQTGMPGDGKIYILPMADAIRIRTGETNEKAIA